MDIRKVKKLIELVEESGVAELEITEGEESVRICRYPSSAGRAAGSGSARRTRGPQGNRADGRHLLRRTFAYG